MAVTAQEDGRARLAIVDLGSMKSQSIAAITDSDIDLIAWVNDSQPYRALAFNKETQRFTRLGEGRPPEQPLALGPR